MPQPAQPALRQQPQKGALVLSQGTSRQATPGATKRSRKRFVLGTWPAVLYPAPKPAGGLWLSCQHRGSSGCAQLFSGAGSSPC